MEAHRGEVIEDCDVSTLSALDTVLYGDAATTGQRGEIDVGERQCSLEAGADSEAEAL